MVIDFCSLPNDVHLLILPRLSFCDILRLEATCRFCRRLCQQYWLRFDSLDVIAFLNGDDNGCQVLSHGYKFDLVASNLVARASPHLKHLNLSNFGPLDYSLQTGLQMAILDHCDRLQAIELNNRILDKTWLLQLAIHNRRNLQRVSLCNVYVRNHAGLDDDLLAELLPLLPALKVLVLRDNKQVRMSCCSSLPPSLVELDVQGCQVCPKYLHEVLQRCPKLRVLAMTYVPGSTLFASPLMRQLRVLSVNTTAHLCLTDCFIQPFNVFANLRSLSISSHMMTDAMFTVIGHQFLNLQELYVVGNRASLVHSVTVSFLQLKKLPMLRKIGTRENPMGRTLLLICYHFPQLVELDLSYAVKERDLDDVWCDIRSNVLEVLIMKGFNSVSTDSASCQRSVLEKLRPSCPSLRKVIL